MAAVEAQGQELQVVEDFDLQVVYDPLTQPAEDVGAPAVDDRARHVDAQQTQHDEQQIVDIGVELGRCQWLGDTPRQLVLDKHRHQDVVDQIAVELGRQQTDPGETHGEQKADEGDALVGLYVGEQAPERLAFADAVVTDTRAGPERAATLVAVLDGLGRWRRVRLRFLFLDDRDRLGARGLHGLGHGRELEIRALGKTHELARLLGQLDDQGAVAHVVLRLDLLDVAEWHRVDERSAAAVGVQHEQPLVGECEPGGAKVAVRGDVGRQQHHQQLTGLQLLS